MPLRLAYLVVLAILVILATRSLPAAADVPSPAAAAATAPRPPSTLAPLPPPVPEPASTYVGAMALASLGSLAATALAADQHSGGLVFIAGIGYVVAGPIVHGASGQSGARIAGSAVMRIGLPVALAIALEGGDDEGVGIIAGAGLGMLIATGIDIGLACVPGPRRAGKPKPGLTPAVSARDRGVSLGLSGTF